MSLPIEISGGDFSDGQGTTPSSWEKFKYQLTDVALVTAILGIIPAAVILGPWVQYFYNSYLNSR